MAYSAEEIMSTRIIALSPDMTCGDAVAILVGNQISGAPVVDYQNNLVGVISLFDLAVSRANEGYLVGKEGFVADYMTRQVITAHPSTPIKEIGEIMLANRIHRVVIVDKQTNKLRGLLSSIDLVKAFQLQLSGRMPTRIFETIP